MLKTSVLPRELIVRHKISPKVSNFCSWVLNPFVRARTLKCIQTIRRDYLQEVIFFFICTLRAQV